MFLLYTLIIGLLEVHECAFQPPTYPPFLNNGFIDNYKNPEISRVFGASFAAAVNQIAIKDSYESAYAPRQ